MGKVKVTNDSREVMRALYVKALIPCGEIGKRLGLSRQTVAQTLRGMGVDTTKRKYVVPCSACGVSLQKTRAEVRKHRESFCNAGCYSDWLKRPAVQLQIQRMRKAREVALENSDRIMPGIFLTSEGDTYIFESRDQMLEWERSGLPCKVFSVLQRKDIEVVNK